MSTTADELKSFNQFVQEHSADERASTSRLSELFDLWMLQNTSGDDYAENVAAVNASIEDFLNGERGTPAGDDSLQLRKQFGLTSE